MKNLWRDEDAEALVARYAADGVGRDVAECLYLTRLLGGEKRLVLHGGGNSSVKTRSPDAAGSQTEVLCVKASGADMAHVEPADLPALDLDRLRRLRALESLAEEDMRGAQRACLLDGGAGDPSVETLLHAFLPHKFIAHCHANAVLSVTNQGDGEALCKALFAARAAVVPYTMSGLELARRAAEIFASEPDCAGLVLMHHGLVSFAEDARAAYGNMVALVTLAEQRIAEGRGEPPPAVPRGGNALALAQVAPILRGVFAAARQAPGDADQPDRQLLSFRTGREILHYLDGAELARYAGAGVATPDHVIRTKNQPLILPPLDGRQDGDGFRQSATAALVEYMDAYRAYLARHARPGQDLTALTDARARVALVPGLGLFGIGRNMAEAEITADIAEAAVDAIAGAEAVGRYQPAAEADIFAIESWSLEQAKLDRARLPLAGQVVVISGGAGAIGAATAREFAAAGAALALLDLDGGKAQEIAGKFAAAGLGLACDVTDEGSVQATFTRVCETFGGVDILISNAGAAWQGRIGEVAEEVLRQSFEINFFAHQRLAQHAVRIMQAQGSGGCLLFNTSKQAINPGADFGPYGLPKAATLFLMRQYALDHGRDGIRANAVNADRIRSGLLSEEMIRDRARARGVSERDYMAGNLLGREVTAEDVARAFLNQALALKTTANVFTVDGGNIAATLR
jgi:rhamnose utilization protein RhaD (predicted bifunctional aldolase and dehydrogenase)/NAD(P)-dependent dehydrogenase (short-subunit alcohol dehydrogenase family)